MTEWERNIPQQSSRRVREMTKLVVPEEKRNMQMMAPSSKDFGKGDAGLMDSHHLPGLEGERRHLRGS
jgi:hypothetical protein